MEEKYVKVTSCSGCPFHEVDPKDDGRDFWGKDVCRNIDMIKITGDQINILTHEVQNGFPPTCPLDDI